MDSSLLIGRVAGLALLVVVGLIAWQWSRRRGDTQPGRIARIGRAAAEGVPDTPATRALLNRWRSRAVRWRWNLAVPAAAAAGALGLLTREEMRIGIGEAQPWVDPVLIGLLGSFVGAIAAEWHHMRPPPRGRRAAALLPRDRAAYLPAGARGRLTVLAAGVLVVTGAGVITRSSVLVGLVGLAVAGVVPAVQSRIVQRPRPMVGADLVAADDAVRRLAVRSVDDAGAGAVLLLGIGQLSAVLAEHTAGVLWRAVGTAQVLALVVALAWWHRSAPHRLVPNVAWLLGSGSSGVGSE